MTIQNRQLPARADVVIIGGGVMGLSTAYHLARAGVERVVLLEKGALGEGSTSRAAGGVRAVFSDEINIALGLHSLATFEQFEPEFAQPIDLHQVGYLFLLDNDEHVQTFTRNAELQNAMGVDSRMISVAEAKRLSPLIDTDGLQAALWSPRDGHCTPESVVQGYARAARAAGVTILTSTPATGIETEGTDIRGVLTPGGTIATSSVVCAAGAWAKQVGAWVDVPLPVEPLRRQIVITEPVPDLDPATPFTIDFSSSLYFHNEGQGLLVGMSEDKDSWSFDTSRDSAWLPGLAEAMVHRMPSVADVGIQSGWAGLYEMTPDHNALIGRSREVPGFFYACGFSGHGFLMGPAVGEVMRDLYLDRTPFIDVTALDLARFERADVRPELNIV
ncbi:NAD(P)/FAD-dependent oxidoreductase [Ornithinimicrobium cavernae]|uniref:NAD(P)/FAD-dependent oxidoreductase n=1 Tax=Ornithinimicrobium cavernae TaxID=2666047 RepID=UPI000D687917|nr:FAD-binding oxidoreductase [Ornithinimicrobium cavernae]